METVLITLATIAVLIGVVGVGIWLVIQYANYFKP